jgi:cysteine desulfurase
MKNDVIYLDHNASTPCDRRVVDAMVPLLTSHHANPSSHQHRSGQQASSLLSDARHRVARSLGSNRASEITFTSGATEANNLVIKGLAESLRDRGLHLVSQVTEHPSVLEPLRYLERNGWQLTLLPVGLDGRIALEQLGPGPSSRLPRRPNSYTGMTSRSTATLPRQSARWRSMCMCLRWTS